MFLKNLWYFAQRGDLLKRRSMVAKILLGEPVLIARDADGHPFALRDICPHRGIPLSAGAFDGREVECCYHGWRFNREGRCTAIPSLVEGQKFNVERVGVRRYPCCEVQGNIWIYFGDETDEMIDPPEIPDIGDRRPNTAFTMPFPCHVDHAVIGLMDPAHGPFVHRAWWWRSGISIHEKAKAFAPALRGFKMVRHPPSSNSAAYKLLGGEMTTEISFHLPSVRIEHIRAGKHMLCSLNAVTPMSETETELNQMIYWTQPWLTPLPNCSCQLFIFTDKPHSTPPTVTWWLWIMFLTLAKDSAVISSHSAWECRSKLSKRPVIEAVTSDNASPMNSRLFISRRSLFI